MKFTKEELMAEVTTDIAEEMLEVVKGQGHYDLVVMYERIITRRKFIRKIIEEYYDRDEFDIAKDIMDAFPAINEIITESKLRELIRGK